VIQTSAATFSSGDKTRRGNTCKSVELERERESFLLGHYGERRERGRGGEGIKKKETLTFTPFNGYGLLSGAGEDGCDEVIQSELSQ